MKIKKLLIVSVLAVALCGCGKHEPKHMVILPDVSGSIDRASLEQAFKAIDEFAGHLQRGDRLTIIPILGDAEAEASGRILRFEVPANRQAYDMDLRLFRQKVSVALAELEIDAISHPRSKTDILGSVRLAQQEFISSPVGSKRFVVVFSDFIQESEGINFGNDKRMTNKTGAEKFATQLTSSWPLDFKGARVFLGSLRSKEYVGLGHERLQAIQRFWETIFNIAGARTDFAVDGPDCLEKSFRHQKCCWLMILHRTKLSRFIPTRNIRFNYFDMLTLIRYIDRERKTLRRG